MSGQSPGFLNKLIFSNKHRVDATRSSKAKEILDVEPAHEGFKSLDGHKYMLLVTYKRNGDAVPMPVWFGRFFFNDTASTEIYTGEDTLSLHDALPISSRVPTTTAADVAIAVDIMTASPIDRKSTRLNSSHT